MLLIYRKLRIVTGLYNEVFGNVFVSPFKANLGLGIVASVFNLVRLSSVSPVILVFGALICLCCTGVLVVFISFMSMVNQYSIKLGARFGGGGLTLSKEGRRLARSFKVESVKSGIFYDIKKITCLTFLGMVGNLAGSVLISLKI